MQTEQLIWSLDGKAIELGCDWIGQGPRVLFLPALSSISTRREMRPLQARLSAKYQTVAVDWPGFGDQPRPRHKWQPAVYASFLRYLIEKLTPLRAVVAAGHGAVFSLAYACAFPSDFGRLVLVAPTWRGPLPTMLNEHRPWFERICEMVDQPVVGPLLYRLNVNSLVVRYMAAGHVYSDRRWLHGERLREKLAVTRAPGARFSSVRFVTGKLDPLATRAEFLDLARRCPVQMLLIYGAETPSRSQGEMKALASIPGVHNVTLPLGKLSVHEEFPDLVSAAIEPFLLNDSH